MTRTFVRTGDDRIIRLTMRPRPSVVVPIAFVMIVLAVGAAYEVGRASGRAPVKKELEHTRSELLAELQAATELVARSSGEFQAQIDSLKKTAAALRQQLAARQSCKGEFIAHVWLFPDHGPPGTKVSLVGDCFQHAGWLQDWRHVYGMFLEGSFPTCGDFIMGVADPHFQVDPSGRAAGSFIVPSGRGSCFQQDNDHSLLPGVYWLGIGCHACSIARFTVTSS